MDGRLAVRRLVESGGVRQLLEGVRRRSEGRDPLDPSQRVRRASGAPRIRRAGTRGSSESALRPRVLSADDGVLARRQGLRQQPRLPGADAGADESRGLCRACMGDQEPVPGRADRLRLERASRRRDARSGAGARDAARTVDLRGLRRRRHGYEGLQPDRDVRVVQGHARRREVQSGLGDVR